MDFHSKLYIPRMEPNFSLFFFFFLQFISQYTLRWYNTCLRKEARHCITTTLVCVLLEAPVVHCGQITFINFVLHRCCRRAFSHDWQQQPCTYQPGVPGAALHVRASAALAGCAARHPWHQRGSGQRGGPVGRVVGTDLQTYLWHSKEIRQLSWTLVRCY